MRHSFGVPLSTPYFRERLWPSWWFAAASLGWSVMLGVAVGAATTVLAGWLVFGVMQGACTWAMWRGAWVVAVTGEGLQVGPVSLPLELAGALAALDAEQTRRARSTGADARAFTVIRAWIGTAVTVEVTDPDDPTPYWLISTRHPREFVEAVAASLAAAPTHD